MEDRNQYDIVIVGYGPVGATLANLLGPSGLRVAVLEREDSYFPLPRAGHIDAEVMRVFQNIGLADELEKTATGTTDGMRFVAADGHILMEWKRGGAKGPSGWISDYMFDQPTLERCLREGVKRYPHVATFTQHEVFAIEQQAEGVDVRAEDMQTGRLLHLRARFVVGCDGARSLVRRMIGSEHVDLGFNQRWLVVDAKEKHDLHLPRFTAQHCNPERPATACPMALGQQRWEFMLKADETALEMTQPERVWDLIEQSVRPVRREDATIVRAAVYTFQSLIAESWRKDRLLIAGDAAHRMPPFLGQGMCAGIRDVANLGWKLVSVCQGRAAPALLDSYQSERLHHVSSFTRAAVAAGRFVQTSDPAEIAERNRLLRENPRAFAPPVPGLGAGLHRRGRQPGAGLQFVQPQVQGQLMDELSQQQFALVCSEQMLRHDATLEPALRAYPRLSLVVLPAAQADALLAEYEATALLLRPDHYVYGGASDKAGLQALLEPLGQLV